MPQLQRAPATYVSFLLPPILFQYDALLPVVTDEPYRSLLITHRIGESVKIETEETWHATAAGGRERNGRRLVTVPHHVG